MAYIDIKRVWYLLHMKVSGAAPLLKFINICCGNYNNNVVILSAS